MDATTTVERSHRPPTDCDYCRPTTNSMPRNPLLCDSRPVTTGSKRKRRKLPTRGITATKAAAATTTTTTTGGSRGSSSGGGPVSVVFAVVLTATAPWRARAAEDEDDDNDKYNYDDDDSSQAAYPAYTYGDNDDDATASSLPSYPASHGLVHVDRYCPARAMAVTSARLTCDSPGAYYYGSKTYRGSEVCIAGDKVNLHLYVNIAQDLDTSSTVFIEIGAGVYNTFQPVVSSTKLCGLQISRTDGASRSCPEPGEYSLKMAFYLPSLMVNSDQDFHFTPDLNITLTDRQHNRLGCARTGTSAMHMHAARRHNIGMWSLGVALLLFGAVFGGLLILAYRRKKRLEKLTERKVTKYQYFRTLPNGQVVPIQHGPPPPPMPPQIIPPIPPPTYNMPPPPREAYHMSNPAYNETHLPTRPVI